MWSALSGFDGATAQTLTVTEQTRMTKKPVTDSDRLYLGLHAAAYMHWMKTRKRTAFFAEQTHANF